MTRWRGTVSYTGVAALCFLKRRRSGSVKKALRIAKETGLELVIPYYPLCTDYTAAELAVAVANDKKRRADSITIVYPDRTAHCATRELPAGQLESFIKAGLDQAAAL